MEITLQLTGLSDEDALLVQSLIRYCRNDYTRVDTARLRQAADAGEHFLDSADLEHSRSVFTRAMANAALRDTP